MHIYVFLQRPTDINAPLSFHIDMHIIIFIINLFGLVLIMTAQFYILYQLNVYQIFCSVFFRLFFVTHIVTHIYEYID